LGLIAVAGACAEVSEDGVGLEDTTWVLVSYGEQENRHSVLEGTQITATFDSTENQLSGSAGCNSYFGAYEVNGSKLSIPGPIAATEMACLEPEGAMDQEQEYLKTLQAAESFQISDGELRISCGDQVLIFTTQ